MPWIWYGLPQSFAYPSGEEGGNFLVQMIFTCLRYTSRKGVVSRRPVSQLQCCLYCNIRVLHRSLGLTISELLGSPLLNISVLQDHLFQIFMCYYLTISKCSRAPSSNVLNVLELSAHRFWIFQSCQLTCSEYSRAVSSPVLNTIKLSANLFLNIPAVSAHLLWYFSAVSQLFWIIMCCKISAHLF